MKIKMCIKIALLLCIISCRKDREELLNRESLITQGAWQIESLEVDPAIDWFGSQVTNVYAQMPLCLRDNITIFKNNGITNYDEGPSKCDLNEPQTTNGTWAFNTDQTILSLTTDGETESWNISELTNQKIVADYQIVEEGIIYTFSIRLAKK